MKVQTENICKKIIFEEHWINLNQQQKFVLNTI